MTDFKKEQTPPKKNDSKIIIITPEQIKRLGLSPKIKEAIGSASADLNKGPTGNFVPIRETELNVKKSFAANDLKMVKKLSFGRKFSKMKSNCAGRNRIPTHQRMINKRYSRKVVKIPAPARELYKKALRNSWRFAILDRNALAELALKNSRDAARKIDETNIKFPLDKNLNKSRDSSPSSSSENGCENNNTEEKPIKKLENCKSKFVEEFVPETSTKFLKNVEAIEKSLLNSTESCESEEPIDIFFKSSDTQNLRLAESEGSKETKPILSKRKRTPIDYAALLKNGCPSPNNEIAESSAKKRRGRKPRNSPPCQINAENSNDSVTDGSCENSEVETDGELSIKSPARNRRGRKPRTAENFNGPMADDSIKNAEVDKNVELSIKSTAKKKRGRKTLSDLIVQESDDAADLKDKVTCAVCSTSFKKNTWAGHKQRYHNNLAWKVGQTPLDLNDQSIVIRILNELVKKKKPLFCEKCGDSKKSAVGYLSHKSVCQKSPDEVEALKVKCELCDKVMMPSSLAVHMNQVHNDKKKKEVVVEEAVAGEKVPENDDIFSKPTREAAKRAKAILENLAKDGEILEGTSEKPKTPNYKRFYYENFDFHPTYCGGRALQHELDENCIIKCRFEDCEFNCLEVDIMATHLYECSKKPSNGFTCKYCLITYNSTEEILAHMESQHSKKANEKNEDFEQQADDCDSDQDDFENFSDDESRFHDRVKTIKQSANPLTQKTRVIKFLFEHKTVPATATCPYPPAYKWAMEFCEKNYNKPNLYSWFAHFPQKWAKLREDGYSVFLPNLEFSMDVHKRKVTNFGNVRGPVEWKNYRLFESEIGDDGNSMIFCGGPVQAMGWAPTPYNKSGCDQVLAVAALKDPDKKYYLTNYYSHPGVIQFWNFGPLHNTTISQFKPQLEFCIGHLYGAIWCLEWCPSGCYDMELENGKRLGLLAIACSSSDVYVYNVGHPNTTDGTIFTPKPVLRLVLEPLSEQTVGKQKFHATRLSWTKAAGHRYLAVGYSHGMVAMFDLATRSKLLTFISKKDNMRILMPYQTFSAHCHLISALSLYHLNDGKRWLMTGSVDRCNTFWDLYETSTPISNFKKFLVTDGVWLNHWLCAAIAYDETCNNEITSTVLNQCRDFSCCNTSLLFSNSTVSTIGGSEWTNGYIQGNYAGEVTGIFPHQLFYAFDSDKSIKNKRLIFGYSKLVEKDSSINKSLEEEATKLEVNDELESTEKSLNTEKEEAITNDKSKSTEQSVNTEESITSESFEEELVVEDNDEAQSIEESSNSEESFEEEPGLEDSDESESSEEPPKSEETITNEPLEGENSKSDESQSTEVQLNLDEAITNNSFEEDSDSSLEEENQITDNFFEEDSDDSWEEENSDPDESQPTEEQLNSDEDSDDSLEEENSDPDESQPTEEQLNSDEDSDDSLEEENSDPDESQPTEEQLNSDEDSDDSLEEENSDPDESQPTEEQLNSDEDSDDSLEEENSDPDELQPTEEQLNSDEDSDDSLEEENSDHDESQPTEEQLNSDEDSDDSLEEENSDRDESQPTEEQLNSDEDSDDSLEEENSDRDESQPTEEQLNSDEDSDDSLEEENSDPDELKPTEEQLNSDEDGDDSLEEENSDPDKSQPIEEQLNSDEGSDDSLEENLESDELRSEESITDISIEADSDDLLEEEDSELDDTWVKVNPEGPVINESSEEENSESDESESTEELPNPHSYENSINKYGLIFCDMKMDSYKDFPAKLPDYLGCQRGTKHSKSNYNDHPLQAVSKVCFNPNNESSFYFATGFQVGFVKVSCLRFLNEKT